ncbi:S-adenosyl-L-methionine-dependent methyltransferase [Chiua virens]|nr:S-adenosyl-L-methionine-dependent methyltransferase [Chiua virens]
MATNHPDGRVNQRIDNYTKFWENDLNQENDASNENRLTNYTDVVNGYYDGVTQGEGFYQALARYEHYLAAQMNLRPGMRVLDVGCGVGGPTREIAVFADVNVVGVNNNEFQVHRARRYTKRAGLEKQVSFVKGDFMKLAEQFGENSFDAVYAIEATCHAPSWEGVYGEIKKVLKPGGVFGVYEWCMTDAWDPSIPSHKELAHQVEIGSGIPEVRSIKQAREAFANVGFRVEQAEDLADRPDEVPWYYPLEGDFRKAQTPWDLVMVWCTSWSGKLVTHTCLRLFEMIGLVPKGTWEVCESLKVAGDALVKGGRTKLFTPMYLVVARKPEEE